MISYLTLQGAATSETVINKSRFIVDAVPVEEESAAISFIHSIREKYRDATHHCYAYIIGKNAGIQRYSDDGEPSGTAGLPMIECLKAKSLVDCCFVVTRYFGGTLLGTGGLVRAYTESVLSGIASAGIVRMEETDRFLCEVPYSLWDKVNHAFRSMCVKLTDIEYAVTVCFTLEIRSFESDSVLEKLTSLTNGTFTFIKEDVTYAPWIMKDE